MFFLCEACALNSYMLQFVVVVVVVNKCVVSQVQESLTLSSIMCFINLHNIQCFKGKLHPEINILGIISLTGDHVCHSKPTALIFNKYNIM